MTPPWIAVAYGGGTNSTAMLCGFRERGIVPNLIAFADTGSEMPETYAHVDYMKSKVREWWNLELHVVHKTYQGRFEGLERACLRLRQLPGLAYGKRSCSSKYKHEPQERILKREMRAQGVAVAIKAIGYGYDEPRRYANKPFGHALTTKLHEVFWYPLVEWRWTRGDCIDAIQRHGLPLPGKSACFFCPGRKKTEVFELRDKHPELLTRALAIEDAAQETNTTDRGLGGQSSHWRKWLDLPRPTGLDLEPHHIPCDCYDGGEEL
jgi:hypothetical protein